MAFYNQGCIDPSDLDSFMNFNQSPSLDKGKGRLQPQAPSVITSPSPSSTILPLDMNDESHRSLQPSHDYGQHKQQTGLPTQAEHLRMLGNPRNLIPNYNSGINESQFYDSLNSANSFEVPSPSDFNIDSFLDSDIIDSNQFYKQEEAASQVRYYPGMHQQQAEAEKAMRQRQLQIEAEQEQRAQALRRSSSNQQPLDQRTEDTITRVMNEIRRSSHIAAESLSPRDGPVLPQILRAKKDEEEMDEDERMLNSEEGKKLSSKERRQLRNKVSARAFRSRRKGK
jgi:bZIP-type transcription factor MBZ1